MAYLETWSHVTSHEVASLADVARAAYSRDCEALKAPNKRKAELAAAGIVILGTAAVIGQAGGLLRLSEEAKAAAPMIDGAEPFAKVGLSEVGKNGDLFATVQNYFFDLDRTFFDTDKAYADHENELTKQLVKHTALPESFVRNAVVDTQTRLRSHFFAANLEEIEPIQALYPGVNLNEKFPEIAPAVQRAYYDALQPPEGAVDLLQDLRARGKNVYAFTSGSPAHTIDKLQGSGLSQFFDKVFTSEKHPFEDAAGSGLITNSRGDAQVVEVMKHPKESTEGYNWIVDYLHIKPSESMMTGDEPMADVFRAKQAGLRGTLATWYREKAQGLVVPDFVAHTPLELHNAIIGAS